MERLPERDPPPTQTQARTLQNGSAVVLNQICTRKSHPPLCEAAVGLEHTGVLLTSEIVIESVTRSQPCGLHEPSDSHQIICNNTVTAW